MRNRWSYEFFLGWVNSHRTLSSFQYKHSTLSSIVATLNKCRFWIFTVYFSDLPSDLILREYTRTKLQVCFVNKLKNNVTDGKLKISWNFFVCCHLRTKKVTLFCLFRYFEISCWMPCYMLESPDVIFHKTTLPTGKDFLCHTMTTALQIAPQFASQFFSQT